MRRFRRLHPDAHMRPLRVVEADYALQDSPAFIAGSDSHLVQPFSLQDAVSALRDGVFNAVEHIHSIRPETRYVNGVLADFHVDGETEEIPVDPRFTEALVCYVVYCAYLKDDSDTENLQNAENYLAKANTLMQI